jgi:MraZ protein
MFTGRFYHNLDEKGRLTIPSGYRDLLLVSGGYITQGFDKNLMVLLSPEFDRIVDRLRHLSMTDPEARLLKRIIISGAASLEIDKAGRILIPQYLRRYAGLESGLVIVGVGEYFEIWSDENWHSQDEQIQNAQENAQRFIAVDLNSI